MVQKPSFVVLLVLLPLFARAADAHVMNLYFDVRGDGNWTLYGATNAPGGIAAAVVNLKNVTSGRSVAPRFGDIGFFMGNIFAYDQAFAGQYPTGESDFGGSKVVHGVGYRPVSDQEFTRGIVPKLTKGNANVLPVPLYTGTWNLSGPAPEIDLSDPPTGAVFATVGTVEAPAAAVVPEIRLPQFTLTQWPPGDFDLDYAVSGSDFSTLR